MENANPTPWYKHARPDRIALLKRVIEGHEIEFADAWRSSERRGKDSTRLIAQRFGLETEYNAHALAYALGLPPRVRPVKPEPVVPTPLLASRNGAEPVDPQDYGENIVQGIDNTNYEAGLSDADVDRLADAIVERMGKFSVVDLADRIGEKLGAVTLDQDSVRGIAAAVVSAIREMPGNQKRRFFS